MISETNTLINLHAILLEKTLDNVSLESFFKVLLVLTGHENLPNGLSIHFLSQSKEKKRFLIDFTKRLHEIKPPKTYV